MGTEQWHADIEVTESIVKTCLQDQFPALAPIKSIRCIGEGWDNKVFLINEKIIFRFPRREIAVELIERENNLLKNLQSLFTVDIPKPGYIGHPSIDYPYPFHGYVMIDGVSGCHANLSAQERVASLPILATFLKQLHNINEAEALAIGAKPQLIDRTNLSRMVDSLNERIDKIIARELCSIHRIVFQEEMKKAQEINLSLANKCLVHGDLYCRHLLFNQKKLTGIIDWGDAGINHRSVDLAVIWSFYPKSCHSLFFTMYGEVDSSAWQYARFLALYGMLTVLLYAHDINDALLVTESMDAIKRINPALLVDK
jgi:aminoglycoside phosphotransferase (APT) family kinase protein